VQRALKSLVVLALVGVLYGCINVAQVWRVGATDQARNVDAIVVLGVAQYDGRPSPQLRARLEHALELWASGRAPRIITTGGNQPGDRFTEAEASANFLIDAGVPSEVITQENVGASTRESLKGVREIAATKGISSVLIVTDPYHALRARLIAQDLGLVAFVSPTRTSPLQGASAASRHVREALGVALSHVIGFANLERLTN
jgi:uncharacterized SAM-binding protein YcdF (DUF218 family)